LLVQAPTVTMHLAPWNSSPLAVLTKIDPSPEKGHIQNSRLFIMKYSSTGFKNGNPPYL